MQTKRMFKCSQLLKFKKQQNTKTKWSRPTKYGIYLDFQELFAKPIITEKCRTSTTMISGEYYRLKKIKYKYLFKD